MQFKITERKTIQNQEIIEYSIKNDVLEVRFLNIGGAITKIALATDNYEQNLVLNYADWSDYLDNSYFLNTLIGRTSNRIVHGRFTLDGQPIQLDINSGSHNLHGGNNNLTHRLFDVSEVADGFVLNTILPHQADGFPGNLDVTVYYQLVDNKFKINYEATTDQVTIVNLTHHAYFNLSGNAKRTIYDHELTLAATHVAEVDDTSGFTEKLLPVAGTRFDFNETTVIEPIGREEHSLFDHTSGYDHLFVLDPTVKTAVKFKDPQSGRTLRVTTNEPALQFYAGNFILEQTVFESGRTGEAHLGACFETHKIPFDFESQILRPGEVYQQTTSFEFTVE